MAIVPDQLLSPTDANYTPGLATDPIAAWKSNLCVVAGDRIQLLSFALTPDAAHGGNLQPDGTSGSGAGFMPHWTYIPKWAHTQDLNVDGYWEEKGRGDKTPTKFWRAANGNIGGPPVIRVDLSDLYCPWDGIVGVQGGMGPTGSPTSTKLIVSYLWDQAGRSAAAEDPWEREPGETLERIVFWAKRGVSLLRRWRRQPVDMRIKYPHRLTYRNPFDSNGSPLPITVPVRADTVWTPEAQTLVLSNGPGTFSTNVRVDGETHPAPVAGFTQVQALGNNVTTIVFGIPL